MSDLPHIPSQVWFTLLIGAVAAERLVELVLSRQHADWARRRGGREYGRRHYPAMVVVHMGLLAGCLTEVWWAGRPFLPWLGWPMLTFVIGAQALRWWCVATLGRRWNTLVIVIPGAPLVRVGPYRWLRHPNYLAVIVEGAALPLLHTAWLTAVAFAAANALVLAVRIRVEDRALALVAEPA